MGLGFGKGNQGLTRIHSNFLAFRGSPVKITNFRYELGELTMVLDAMFKNLSKRAIANIFSVAFVSKFQRAFKVYSFTKEEENFFGTKRSYQRFEQCIQFVESNLGLAFDALLAEKLFDKSVQNAFMKLVKDMVIALNPYLWGKIDVNRITAMFTHDALNKTKVLEAFKDLKLEGSESLLEMYIEIDRFQNPLVFEFSDEKKTNEGGSTEESTEKNEDYEEDPADEGSGTDTPEGSKEISNEGNTKKRSIIQNNDVDICGIRWMKMREEAIANVSKESSSEESTEKVDASDETSTEEVSEESGNKGLALRKYLNVEN